MLLSAVSVLVVAQSSSEVPEGLMNNPVLMSAFTGFALPILMSQNTPQSEISYQNGALSQRLTTDCSISVKEV